jgi:hypothetical protein
MNVRVIICRDNQKIIKTSIIVVTMQNSEAVNKWYNHGISYLEKSMGIELSLIEKARFRELVKDSVRRHGEIKGHWARFCLGHEAIDIFLNNYYGLPYIAENENSFDLADR